MFYYIESCSVLQRDVAVMQMVTLYYLVCIFLVEEFAEIFGLYIHFRIHISV